MLIRSVVVKKTLRMAFQVCVCVLGGGGGLSDDRRGSRSETIWPAGPNHLSETAGAHITETIPLVPRSERKPSRPTALHKTWMNDNRPPV
jgi:hypothetical protein